MQRITVHFQDGLARECRLAADAAGQTLSMWFTRAVQARLFEQGRPAGDRDANQAAALPKRKAKS